MQQAIAYGTMIGMVALVLTLPRTAIGHRVGPASAAGLGVLVLIVTGVIGWADLTTAFDVLWRPFLTIMSIMVTTAVAERLGILDFFAGLIEPDPGRSARAFSARSSSSASPPRPCSITMRRSCCSRR